MSRRHTNKRRPSQCTAVIEQEQSLQEGDCVQVIRGELVGKHGYIRVCKAEASMCYGQWEYKERGVEYVYVMFDEIVQRKQHTCEHGSIAMSAKWKWCRKTDIVKVANNE